MARRGEFSPATRSAAEVRQSHCCGSCGQSLVNGEAHHLRHVKFGGDNSLGNCVVLCRACHYSIHEGGNYRYGTVMGEVSDFPHFYG